MQLAQVGRNEPCPCGSGRKYKKCCVDKQAPATAAGSADLDVAAVVARAIEHDDWDAAHEIFDQGFVLFEPGAPLEHVRFRDDLISANVPDRAELPRLCSGGWIQACEREIGYVLDRIELDARERDGLRLAVYMLRRFGARSPLVEAVAELQAAERGVRGRKLAETLSRLGLTVDDLRTGPGEVSSWVERERPAVLPFADWCALSTADEDQREAVWWSGISGRVCDVSLSLLEQPRLRDAREWMQLAALALVGGVPHIVRELAALTPARVATDDERRVFNALTLGDARALPPGAIAKIASATEARGDFAGAALLRDALQRVQTTVR